MTDHGRMGTYNNGCRCDACRRANRLRRARWDLNTRYGAVPTFVDAAPVRAHIAALRASGWTLAEIGREIGRGSRGVHHIVVGHSATSPSVRRDTAEAILSLRPLEPVVDPVVVDRLLAGRHDWRRATFDERLEAGRIAMRQPGGYACCEAVLHLGPRAIRRLRDEVAAERVAS
jgi:hypothetical protein